MIEQLGRYEIIEELGRGAMGVVYKGRDPLIGRQVAIKAIDLSILPNNERQSYAARFYQEAKAAGNLNHPNIVTIHDLGESGDMAYIAMELMEGRELEVVMDGVRRLSIEKSLNIAIQVADGLYFAHQHGIVHRDIKPTNIMLLGDNRVKIADFGIAQISAATLRLTQAGLIIGSPLYMSPEQISSDPIDARSDIFSFGVVLYQMLTGRLPFTGENPHAVMFQIVNEEPERPSSIDDDIPEMLDEIVLKCLAKKPEARYANAHELANDLRACLEKFLRARAVIDNPLISGARFNHLRKLATPGAISQRFVASFGYLAMISVFAADMISHTNIQTHLLYIFPLILISYHCERMALINAAVLLSLSLQSILIATATDLSIPARIVLSILVIPSNVMVAYVARLARANFLEVGRLMSHDKLTGLRNRLSFEAILDAELERRREHGGVFSLAYIDIDKLKELNDSKGALTGDEAIKLVASVIREHIRSFDSASRLGGDEFAILMPNTSDTDCDMLCRELARKIAARLEEANLPVSASVGHVSFEQVPASISDVFHKAENAMLTVQAAH